MIHSLTRLGIDCRNHLHSCNYSYNYHDSLSLDFGPVVAVVGVASVVEPQAEAENSGRHKPK